MTVVKLPRSAAEPLGSLALHAMTDQPRDPATEVHRVADPSATRVASYLAQRDEVSRVLLLYSGGLDTSVMLKWIQDEYEAEVVALTVNLGQPGEDYEVVRGKALRLGALDCHVVDAREEFAREYVLPGDQGQRRLRRRLPAVHRARAAADRQARGRVRAPDRLRHDRPRLHRQGQRPGADRGHDRDARAGAQGDRAGPLVGDGPRRGDRLRAQARDPGQGRDGERAVLDRRQPLGPLVRGQVDRGPLARARRRRLPARHAAGARAGRGRGGDGRVRGGRAGRAGRRAAGARRADRARRRDRHAPRGRDRRPHRGPDRRPQGARHLRGAGRGDPAEGAPRARAAVRDDPPEPVQAGARPAAGPTSSTRACGGSRCARTSRPTSSTSTSA